MAVFCEEGMDMRRRIQCASMGEQIVAASVVGLVFIGMSGCASEPAKPAATVTPEQVRGHADATFQKLKQEEQPRSVDPAMPR